MRGVLLACLLAVSASAQPGPVGVFTGSTDVGTPPIKGAARFDAATGQYRITGSGTDIWGTADEFHYTWREMTGDVAITATATFLTGGNPHRKAVIMLRENLDTGSPFVHLAIHGDGMPAVQFRATKGDTTNTIDFPGGGPGVWKLKLERKANAVTVWVGKDGAPLQELGHTLTRLGATTLVGLGVSSHTRDATCTVLFTDVSVEQLPAARP